jgi:hypothetical protein
VTVGKKAKKQQRQLEREAAALAQVAQLLEHIEVDASGRLEQMVGTTRREAETFVRELATLLADARVAARDGIDEITASVRDVSDRCVERQAVAHDLDARAIGYVEQIKSQGDASLAQLEDTLTEATTRFEASQRAIDEQVDLFGAHVARRVALVTAESDRVRQRLAELAVEKTVEQAVDVEEPPRDGDAPPDGATAHDEIWQDLARATVGRETAVEDDEFFFSRLADELRAETDESDSPTTTR